MSIGGFAIRLGYDSETVAAIIGRILGINVAFDFASANLLSEITFTRASTGTYINSSGYLVTANTDTPRYDYRSGGFDGLIYEAASTNRIYNPNAASANAASGSQPSTWAITANGSGLVRTIVATGIDKGHEYVDIRVSGTSNQACSMSSYFSNSKAINVAVDQYATAAIHVRMVAGDLTGITNNSIRIVERDAAGSFIGSNAGITYFTPANTEMANSRIVAYHRFAHPGVIFGQFGHRFDFSNNAAINVTFRYSYPQFESNTNISTSTITTGGYATRAADNLTIRIGNGSYRANIVAGNNRSYRRDVLVTDGSLRFNWANNEPIFRERHLKSITLPRANSDLIPFVNFELISANAALYANTSTDGGAPPTFTYTLVNKELWQGYGRTIGDWADVYLAEGPTSIIAARNVRNWLIHFATNDYMRVTANQSYEASSDQSDYVTERNWTCGSIFPAYLKTKNSGVYSYQDRVTIEAWVSRVAYDAKTYYNWESVVLGSKHNNHMMWATNCVMWAAIIGNDPILFEWAVHNVKHILDDDYPDVVTNDGVSRHLVSYRSGSEGSFIRGGLQLELDRGNSAFFYPMFWTSAATVVAANARKNGTDLFEYQGVNGNFKDIYNFIYQNVLDRGNTIMNLTSQYAEANTGPTSFLALNVATHSTDNVKFGSMIIFAKLYPALNVSSYITGNLRNGNDQQVGGDYKVLEKYIT